MSHHGEEGVALEWRLKKGGEEREGQRRLLGGKRALSQEKAQLGMENHVLLAQVTKGAEDGFSVQSCRDTFRKQARTELGV